MMSADGLAQGGGHPPSVQKTQAHERMVDAKKKALFGHERTLVLEGAVNAEAGAFRKGREKIKPSDIVQQTGHESLLRLGQSRGFRQRLGGQGAAEAVFDERAHLDHGFGDDPELLDHEQTGGEGAHLAQADDGHGP